MSLWRHPFRFGRGDLAAVSPKAWRALSPPGKIMPVKREDTWWCDFGDFGGSLKANLAVTPGAFSEVGKAKRSRSIDAFRKATGKPQPSQVM